MMQEKVIIVIFVFHSLMVGEYIVDVLMRDKEKNISQKRMKPTFT